jgi:hypothetical protein
VQNLKQRPVGYKAEIPPTLCHVWKFRPAVVKNFRNERIDNIEREWCSVELDLSYSKDKEV